MIRTGVVTLPQILKELTQELEQVSLAPCHGQVANNIVTVKKSSGF